MSFFRNYNIKFLALFFVALMLGAVWIIFGLLPKPPVPYHLQLKKRAMVIHELCTQRQFPGIELKQCGCFSETISFLLPPHEGKDKKETYNEELLNPLIQEMLKKSQTKRELSSRCPSIKRPSSPTQGQ